MGLEAACEVRIRRGAALEEGEAKALLESVELILRGGIKRRWAIASLSGLVVAGEALQFSAGGEQVQLLLGATVAAKWLAKLGKPPPTLAQKLGLGPAALAAVFGPQDDANLAQALAGHVAADPAQAAMLVAVMHTEDELQAALVVHARLPCRAFWAVIPKGPRSTLPEAVVRSTLRAAGYADNKTSAVSERLTATRYQSKA